MKINQKIRWQQRFQNFDKSYKFLKETIAIQNPSDAEQAGLMQFFEMTFELAWKTLKDYLVSEGFSVKSPRDTIKQAFQNEMLDGHVWLKALNDRNLTSHLYDKKKSQEIEKKVREIYFPAIKQLHEVFLQKLQ